MPEKWTSEQLEQLFTERLENVRKTLAGEHQVLVATLAERSKNEAEALKVALATLEKRLDGMNEFRESLSDQRETMVPRGEFTAEINLTKSGFSADLAPIRAELQGYSETNWPVWISAAFIAVSLVTGVWFVIGLKIDSANAPITLQLVQQHSDIAAVTSGLNGALERLRIAETQASASSAADLASRGDRQQLNDRMRNSETADAAALAEQRATSLQFASKLVEIETQFRSISTVFNVQAEHTDQWFHVLYETVFPGKEYPTGHYRPNMSSGSQP